MLDEAKLAISQGKNLDGFQYLYAHYLCGDSGAADVQSHMRWSPALRRHTVAVQVGIGIVYTAPKDYTGNPMAIGNDAQNKPQNTGTKGRRRGRREGGGANAAPGAIPGAIDPAGLPGGDLGMPSGGGSQPSGVRGSLDYYTGELGELLVQKLEEKLDEGMFGDVQREMEVSADAAAGQTPMFPGALPGAALPGDPAAIGAPPGADPGLPGAAFPGADGGGGGGAAPKAESGGFRPGIVFLGTAASKEALDKKAQEQGLDVLIVFDVKVQRPGKTKIVRNSTKISVHYVDRPQEVPIHTSPTLTNVEVAAEREKEKDGDPVDDEINKLIAKLESHTTSAGTPQTLKLSPFLDSLQPQQAANRVTNLASSPTDHPLMVLAEIKLYHAKKLITDEQFAEAAKVFLKDKADLLSKGKEDERKQAVAALLPRKAAAPKR